MGSNQGVRITKNIMFQAKNTSMDSIKFCAEDNFQKSKPCAKHNSGLYQYWLFWKGFKGEEDTHRRKNVWKKWQERVVSARNKSQKAIDYEVIDAAIFHKICWEFRLFCRFSRFKVPAKKWILGYLFNYVEYFDLGRVSRLPGHILSLIWPFLNFWILRS